ncbi:transposase [Sorangium sp. So ce296]|uniref:transposase n=1 Tax=Sorangium sp. So ce296 TaxID=3133296 RepID=UPI003F5EBC44
MITEPSSIARFLTALCERTCAVRIAADDGGRRSARERLVRYCSRSAFALDRIELLPDGRIASLLKTPRRGRTDRVMSPMEFMARLAALIPPPKIPLVRWRSGSTRRRRAPGPSPSWRTHVAVVEPELHPMHGARALRRGERVFDAR